MKLLTAFFLLCATFISAEQVGPWNLDELKKAPTMQWLDQKAPVHSLLYRGEVYQDHPTDVFAFYASPITLGLDESEASGDLLINLGMSVPAFFNRFPRVAEVVIEEAESRQAARENFRFYRQGGYPLQDHKLQRV